MNILSAITFLPVLGVILLIFLNKENHRLLKTTTFMVTIINFIISLPLFLDFNPASSDMQFVERISWIGQYGITYHVGIDGISLFLVLLTTLLSMIAVLACWADIKKKVKEFMICLLFLETGMIGVFISLDLFLFYCFWEVMLIPMYLLIGIWGSPARRIYAAVKFFLYTMFGSLLMLVAILYLYFLNGSITGTYTFDLLELYKLTIP
jgi:NADH-quinone oxidoreductase subunit M